MSGIGRLKFRISGDRRRYLWFGNWIVKRHQIISSSVTFTVVGSLVLLITTEPCQGALGESSIYPLGNNSAVKAVAEILVP